MGDTDQLVFVEIVAGKKAVCSGALPDSYELSTTS